VKRHEILSSDAYRETLGRFLREPLVHFLLLGALIFGAFKFISSEIIEPGKILISQGRIESLEIAFSRTWRRPPTASELEELVRDYIREEVFAREAVAVGLDKDDTIIRRRLRQKLEFVSEDVTALAEPTDEQLRAYLKEHPEAFRGDRWFTFRQVYLDPQRRGANLGRDAAQLLAQLRRAGSNADIAALGDSLMLENEFKALPASEAVKQFGEKFVANLGEIRAGQWQGPIESGFGVHLVFMSERTDGSLPALEDVRPAVRREWANARRVDANEKFYQTILHRYVVTIERPEVVKATDVKQVAEAQ
jgi:parvulin-like peptidyl-prolyl cis-trans isomerase-like protein